MTTKTTPFILIVFMLLISSYLCGQTVTDVFPTRVTYQTKITVLGSGFSSNPSVSINSSTIGVTNKVIVSDTEMTFEISTSGNSDITGNLTIASSDTGYDIEYVRPTTINYDSSTDVSSNISEIFTNWNGFWRSSSWSNSDTSTWPNDSHELLAFTYNGVTYSTGVDDNLLTSEGITFTSQIFKAYSTNGVDGQTNSQNYIATGDLIDNTVNEGTSISSSNISGLTVFDVIIDGVNGLDLGTGITNFNTNNSVRFFSGNGQPGAISDGIPDLIVTQIAQAGGTDWYYYADELGNVVGRPVKLKIYENNNTRLAEWRLDLYRFNNGISFDVATPVARSFGSNEHRPLRMVALKLEDFAINASSIPNVNNINMMAGGTADVAFLAYNRASFDIKAPVASPVVSRYVCQLNSGKDVSFSVVADVDGGSTGTPEEVLNYQWMKYNSVISGEIGSSIDIDDVITSDLGTYKVRVSNEYGTILVPTTLAEGGTPTFWNGSNWELPVAYTNAGITVNDSERSLIFSNDYSENTDLEGCDCRVAAGNDVIIPAGKKLKLYGSITVDPLIPETTDGLGNTTPEIPAGTFILEDNASLIQTKSITSNQNSGSITVKRQASDLHTYDYVYWSSPVENFNISGIPGNNKYEWHVNDINANGTRGDWATASGVMTLGRGYIARVPSSTTFTTSFVGKPTNGNVTFPVYKSTSTTGLDVEDRHCNLIGNPYPSAINADEFLAANSSILDGKVYIWTHGTPISGAASNPYYSDFGYNYDNNDYLVYNYLGSTYPNFDGNIGSGQGFFVQVKSTYGSSSGNINFTNDMRYDGSENAYDNTQFFRSSQEATTTLEKQLVWLALVDENQKSSVALVGYAEGATYGEDNNYDAYTLSEDFGLFSFVENSKMAIQGRPLPFDTEDTVQLGFQIPSNGIYHIAIDQLAGNDMLNDSQGIYLEDTYTNSIHDLKDSPYSFTANQGFNNDRFILRYTSEQLSVAENDINNTLVYVSNNELHVKNSNSIDSIEVYNVTGQKVVRFENVNSTNFESSFDYASAVYMVVLNMSNGNRITKKVIK